MIKKELQVDKDWKIIIYDEITTPRGVHSLIEHTGCRNPSWAVYKYPAHTILEVYGMNACSHCGKEMPPELVTLYNLIRL